MNAQFSNQATFSQVLHSNRDVILNRTFPLLSSSDAMSFSSEHEPLNRVVDKVPILGDDIRWKSQENALQYPWSTRNARSISQGIRIANCSLISGIAAIVALGNTFFEFNFKHDIE